MEPPPYEGSGWYEDDGQDTGSAGNENEAAFRATPGGRMLSFGDRLGRDPSDGERLLTGPTCARRLLAFAEARRTSSDDTAHTPAGHSAARCRRTVVPRLSPIPRKLTVGLLFRRSGDSVQTVTHPSRPT
jgi:hypothetical protein